MTMDIFENFGQTFFMVTRSLAPLVILFLVFQFAYLKLPKQYIARLLFGLALGLIGAVIFLQGVHVAFFPVGEEMGRVLADFDHKWLLMPLGFVMGYLATFGEPAVRVLGNEVENASGGSIRKSIIVQTISLGVGIFVGLGMARIIYGLPLVQILIPGYALALAMLWFTDKNFTSIAFDAGGVATGPMAVTFLLAIAVGIASALEGRDPVADGFGLIALIALAPILSILTVGLLVRIKTRKRG